MKDIIDKVLIADFFFILFALFCLVVAVVAQFTTDDSSLADLWLSLWPFVFQPAIGLFMAGALVSGGVGWINEQKEKMTGGN